MNNEQQNEEIWIDTRLSKKEMEFLNTAILNVNSDDGWSNMNAELAGNISKSELLVDKDNWFYDTILKKLTEKRFREDHNSKNHIDKEPPLQQLPKFKLTTLWVNYQKQFEFNPLHNHGGLYSFVIFIQIPTHWKEQHDLPFSVHSNSPVASDFEFVWSEGNANIGDRVVKRNFPLSSKD